ncbi:MAG: hypothetical protein ACT4PV_09560 [Planctomycetaceae bacterium]
MRRLLAPLAATALVVALFLANSAEEGRRGSPGAGRKGAGSARQARPSMHEAAAGEPPPP